MKFDRSYDLKEFANELELEFSGNPKAKIEGMNEIHRLEKGDIVFVDHPKYYQKALNSIADVIIINQADVDIPEGKGIIIHDEPFTLFNKLLSHFSPIRFPGESKTQNDFKNCKIHPSVFIDELVEIGEGCVIYPNVQLLGKVILGKNVVIQSGTVIGSHGFYYKKRAERFERLGSEGSVRIDDGAEIGANCTIDRGVSAETLIGKNTVIDNLVQIGHDTIIGERCLIAAQCGIAGCTVIENGVTLWGQVGLISGITIGENAVIYAQSGVGKSLPPNQVYMGSPAGESRTKLKELASLKALPGVVDKLKKDGRQ